MEYQTDPKNDQIRNSYSRTLSDSNPLGRYFQSLAGLDNLPDPDRLVIETFEGLEEGLKSFRKGWGGCTKNINLLIAFLLII